MLRTSQSSKTKNLQYLYIYLTTKFNIEEQFFIQQINKDILHQPIHLIVRADCDQHVETSILDIIDPRVEIFRIPPKGITHNLAIIWHIWKHHANVVYTQNQPSRFLKYFTRCTIKPLKTIT